VITVHVMSIAAPPKPTGAPPVGEPADHDALQALIEEARRRARRRRRRYVAVALLLAGGIAAGVTVFGGHNAPVVASADGSSPGQSGRGQASVRAGVRNGPLTVIDGDGIVSVDARGRARQLFRCQASFGSRFCTVIEGLAWSRTGRELLFSATTISIASRYHGMHVLDLATGRVRSAGMEAFLPDWSLDGRIALVDPAAFPVPIGWIYLRRVDGRLATQTLLSTGTQGDDSSPSWSPDGKQLVFATRQNGVWTVSLIDADGSHRRLLATHASSPAWSPDGTLVAYRTPCGVKLMTPSGREVIPAFPATKCHTLGVRGVPTWSPDGKRIAIPARNGIYVMDRDGRNRSLLSLVSPSFTVGHHERVAWEPISTTPSPPSR
jgi:hypothetical protein